MNYTIRDMIMWRWCATTFFVSLLFSILVAIFHPWNLVLPQQAPWLVPPITPAWLVWPIANSLLVLIFVWVKTNALALQPFWDKTRWHSYLRAVLQALFITAFSSSYDLHTFVISSIVISVFISAYFSSDFDATKRHYLISTYDDEVPNTFSYGFGSTMVFFYTLIVLSGLANLTTSLSVKQALLIFLFTPLIYPVSIIVMTLVVLLLLLIARGLKHLLATGRLYFWPLLRQVGQWTLSLAINILVATGLLITLLCLVIAGLWKGACRGKHWLLPTHQS